MAGAVPTIFWFDRWDERVGILPVTGELVHTEEINGEDTIELSSWEVPAKGDRLLWRDGSTWREHVVVRTDEPLEGPCEVYAESSLCELLVDYVEDRRVVTKGIAYALGIALEQTRWTVGAVTGYFGADSCWLYHVNSLEAVRRIADQWGGEVAPVIAVADGRVSSRSLRVARRLGASRGLRFEYGRNMAGCTRTVLEDEVYTAMYGYGMGLPITDEYGDYTGGYRRKLTFGDINGGKNYVEDAEALELYGLWDAQHKVKRHRFGQVTFGDCEDKYVLRNRTRWALNGAKQPQVSYEVDVAALDGGDAELGDTVAVIDTSRDPEWRLKARIVRRVRTFSDCVLARVTIGTVQKASYAAVSSLAADVAALQDDVIGIDGQLTATATTEYVTQSVAEAIDDLDDLSEVDF